MNLKFVETFVLASRLGSFSKTAERLHTTLAAVSLRIQNLEEELGVVLFDRSSGRQLRLTSKGLELLPMAERLVQQADQLLVRAKNRESYAGRVRLGVIDTAANALLARLLGEVETRFPQVEIDLQADTSHRLVARMADGQIDLAITLVGQAPPGARVRRLISLACHWVASPVLLPADRDISLEELATHAVLSFAQGSEPQERTSQSLAAVGGPRRLYCGTSLVTTLGLAKQGLGVAVLPAALVQDEIAMGQLHIIRCPPPFRSLDIQVSYLEGPGSYLLAALAETAIDVARAYCEATRPAWAWMPTE